MVTASIPYPSVAARSARTRTPLRDRVSTGTATALSVLGLIGLGAVLVLGLLVVPIAAAIAFGPALLAAL
ncbi:MULTISPECIES: hypothetical protein [Microbacterium]|uniref:hypothetical protein n=1 Tax=Microbacterium TaxID=33882 RepID=UPI001E2ACF15|nr:hypothetical protein [Microbacterium sp. F2E]MCC9053686.1 hypothetical protein [Microbacterium sp. F2E]